MNQKINEWTELIHNLDVAEKLYLYGWLRGHTEYEVDLKMKDKQNTLFEHGWRQEDWDYRNELRRMRNE